MIRLVNSDNFGDFDEICEFLRKLMIFLVILSLDRFKRFKVSQNQNLVHTVCFKFHIFYFYKTLSLAWFSINLSMHQFEAVTVKVPWEVPKDEIRQENNTLVLEKKLSFYSITPFTSLALGSVLTQHSNNGCTFTIEVKISVL